MAGLNHIRFLFAYEFYVCRIALVKADDCGAN